jgi:glucose-1-phosphate thymidylyltransferase
MKLLQKRTGQIIGSPEKIAYEQDFINKEQLQKLADPLKKSGYGSYLC